MRRRSMQMAGKKGRQIAENRAKTRKFMAKNEQKGRICVIFKVDCAVAAKTTNVHFGEGSPGSRAGLRQKRPGRPGRSAHDARAGA